ncbi:MAG TPA: DUF434 domain-containing protein [Opitutaceae bacterium]|nr:DUF434 domain-containing protein [Opitutaceae bacterium]
MPDTRTHRGPHPEDAKLFAPAAWPALRRATTDLCWLLSRDYAAASALKLVGDRYQLAARQRAALERCACPDTARGERAARRLDAAALAGRALWLDGYNVLTTVEVALGGGVILAACDGTYRDIASMHGTYRKVAETLPALELLGQASAVSGASPWIWYLDRPVSNSGRLKRIMEDLARERGWPWQIELVPNPDAVLVAAMEIIVTADSVVLDQCRRWFNLTREVIDRQIPNACIVPLAG